jgi:hypothetical protein
LPVPIGLRLFVPILMCNDDSAGRAGIRVQVPLTGHQPFAHPAMPSVLRLTPLSAGLGSRRPGPTRQEHPGILSRRQRWPHDVYDGYLIRRLRRLLCAWSGSLSVSLRIRHVFTHDQLVWSSRRRPLRGLVFACSFSWVLQAHGTAGHPASR